MENSPWTHTTVLLNEAIAALLNKPQDLPDVPAADPADGTYVDGTFGAGGYSRAILAVPGTRVIGIDRDRTAITAGFGRRIRSRI